MAGKGILIVEDEMLIALSLEDVLSDAGYEVSGIANTLDRAFEKLASCSFGAAILDINLGPQLVWPFASSLKARGIAFAFLSSDCERDDFPQELSLAPKMCKPFDEIELLSVVRSLVLARCA